MMKYVQTNEDSRMSIINIMKVFLGRIRIMFRH